MKTLLPHQLEDAQFLASRKFAGNFSGMGSGKTLTALEAARILNVVEAPQSTIIIGPPISLHMWSEEFKEFFPGSATQIVKASSDKLSPKVDAYILSYTIATKRRDELRDLGAKVLILDESHALKNPLAKRTGAIIGRHGICEGVDHTWCLTGTPSTKYNDDLFTFMTRADAALLKSHIGKLDLQRFKLRYCRTEKKKFSPRQRFPTEVTTGNRNTTELNDMLFAGGMAVRRELAEVWAAMPPLTMNRLQVRLDRSAELTQALKLTENMTMNEIRQGLAQNDESLSRARRLLGEAKVKYSVEEIIDRVEAGTTPILVGCWHRNVIDAVVLKLQKAGIPFRVIDGRTSSAQDTATQAMFNAGKFDVCVVQIASAGVSLNLQGGSHIVCIEEDFSPAIMDQFFARCHRIGQANHVHVDVFESDTKLDKAIRRISVEKARGHNTLMEQKHG